MLTMVMTGASCSTCMVSGSPGAARLLVEVVDVHSFTDGGHLAWLTGAAPIDVSSSSLIPKSLATCAIGASLQGPPPTTSSRNPSDAVWFTPPGRTRCLDT